MGRPVQVLIGVAAALVALIVVGVLFLGGGDEESTTTTEAPASAPATPTTGAPTTAAAAPASAAPTTALSPAAAEPTTTPAPDTTISTSTTTPPTTTVPPPSAPWLGTWELIEETRLPPGAPPAAPGVEYFVTLTLTDGAFHSAYSDTFGQDCDWEGSSTAADDSTLAWADISSAVFPCSQADGISSLVIWSMPDADTLILDMADMPGGTLQTYTRAEPGE